MFQSEKSGLVQRAGGVVVDKWTDKTCFVCWVIPVTCSIFLSWLQPGHLLIHSIIHLIFINHQLFTRHFAKYRNAKMNNKKSLPSSKSLFCRDRRTDILFPHLPSGFGDRDLYKLPWKQGGGGIQGAQEFGESFWERLYGYPGRPPQGTWRRRVF